MYKVVYGGRFNGKRYSEDDTLIVFANYMSEILIAVGAGDEPDTNASMIVSALNAVAGEDGGEDQEVTPDDVVLIKKTDLALILTALTEHLPANALEDGDPEMDAINAAYELVSDQFPCAVDEEDGD